MGIRPDDRKERQAFYFLIFAALRLGLRFACLLAGVSAAAAQPVGMILEGPAQVTRNEVQLTLQMADLLHAGDLISAAPGKVVFVFCPQQGEIELSSGAAVRLGGEGLVPISGPEPVVKKAEDCTLPEVALGSESLEHLGATQARPGTPPIVVYLGNRTSHTRPTFEWEAAAEAESYRLTLNNGAGETIWSASLDSPRLDYPEEQDPLPRGDYFLRLQGLRGKRTVAEEYVNFSIDPDPELAQPPSPGAANPLLRAFALEKKGYYWEAARLFRELRRANPQDRRLTRRLLVLYSKAGLFSAANLERQRLNRETGNR